MHAVQEFEVFLRHKGIRTIDDAALAEFKNATVDRGEWVNWLDSLIGLGTSRTGETLSALLDMHLSLAGYAAGNTELKTVFSDEAGEAVSAIFEDFKAQSDHKAALFFQEYQRLVENALANASVRPQREVRSDVMVWGTLEARGQSADLVILAGLNEGTWPSQPTPDPWLNRSMRREIGLLLPERQIGLETPVTHWTEFQGSRELLIGSLKDQQGAWAEFRDAAVRQDTIDEFRDYAMQWY